MSKARVTLEFDVVDGISGTIQDVASILQVIDYHLGFPIELISATVDGEDLPYE